MLPQILILGMISHEWWSVKEFMSKTPDLKDSAPTWLAAKFYHWLDRRHQFVFTSDEFREANLTVYIDREDTGISKSLGAFFGGMKQRGYIMESASRRSRILSNHGRKITTYHWTPFGITELCKK
jgi:hypothetical protein